MRKTLLMLIVLFLGLLQARTLTGTAPTGRIYDKKWLNINAWKVPFYNDGRYGIDAGVLGGDRAGGSWPQPLNNFYIFGAGIWIGCLQDTVDASGLPKTDTLVSFSYNPNTGGSEMVPGNKDHWREAVGSELDRIYKYPEDWPPPRDRYAPNPKDTVFVPFKNFSLQDMWCVFCDLDPNKHTSLDTRPMGIEVYLTVYAWNYSSNNDIFFLKYTIKNVSGRALRKMYVGAVMDPDIGSARDDLVGLIKDKWFKTSATDSFRVKNVGFAYDSTNKGTKGPYWEKGTPGCVAYKFLEGPVKESTGEPVMTAFKIFKIEFDPPRDPARYLTMAGYDYRSGVYNPYDSVDTDAADKRFIQASGPFDLPADSATTIIIAVIAAEFGKAGEAGLKKDTLALAKVAATAQFIYDQNWLLPGPPPSPSLTLVPGDKKITLIWNNISEITPDPYYAVASDPRSSGYNPFYRQYDFEGYKVYKSKDGTSWQLLTQCDLKNGIVYAETSRVIEINPNGDTVVVAESIGTNATDNGTFYRYVDSDVANGFTYYYAITAYDYNFEAVKDTVTGNTVPRLLVIEGGKVLQSVIPRSEPERIVPPSPILVTQTVGDSARAALRVDSVSISAPHLITGDTYELRFIEPEGEWVTYTKVVGEETTTVTKMMPFYRYYVFDVTKKDTVIPVSKWMYNWDLKESWKIRIPCFDGVTTSFMMKWLIPDNVFETVSVDKGSYTGKLAPWPAPEAGRWAYRGADYRLTWHRNGADLTLEVWDITNNRAVPYTSYEPRFPDTTDNPKKANGWNFSFIRIPPSKTLRSTDKAIYICGGFIALNMIGTAPNEIGSLMDQIKDGDVWIAKVAASTGLAPTGNVFQFDTKNSVLKFDTAPQKLAVRVVPNPYLITNAWEKSLDKRIIAFTHLPNECTIRIYNLAGDLVKVINHRETTGRFDNPTLPITNDLGGTATWNLLNDNNQLIATGVYIFHVQSKIGEQVGKFVIVR